jgi:hypothetical protein
LSSNAPCWRWVSTVPWLAKMSTGGGASISTGIRPNVSVNAGVAREVLFVLDSVTLDHGAPLTHRSAYAAARVKLRSSPDLITDAARLSKICRGDGMLPSSVVYVYRRRTRLQSGPTHHQQRSVTPGALLGGTARARRAAAGRTNTTAVRHHFPQLAGMRW